MVGRLNGRGLGPLAALTLLVLALHLGLLGGARRLMGGWNPDTPEPDRLQAAFVRQLKPAAPPSPSLTPPKGGEGTPGAEAARTRAGLTSPKERGAAPLSPEGVAHEAVPEAEALALPPDLQLPDASGPFVPGVEWPLSTELRYQLTGNYRGPVYGQARVQWLRDGSHYQVHLEAEIGPHLVPLMTRRLSSDGEITPLGLVPHRFDEVTGGLAGGNRKTTMVFDDGGVRMGDGRRESVVDNTQDGASQFVQLTWLFLTGRQTAQPGWLVQLPLALPRNVHGWRYRVLALEKVDTPMGPIEAWHLDSDMLDTFGDMQTELWLAPSLQYLPVRIRIWQNRPKDMQTYIDLALREAPLQAVAANPASAASGAASAPGPAGSGAGGL